VENNYVADDARPRTHEYGGLRLKEQLETEAGSPHAGHYF